MTKKQAQKLAKQIERDDSKCHVQSYMNWGDSYDVEVLDTRTGCRFVVDGPENWQERLDGVEEQIDRELPE